MGREGKDFLSLDRGVLESVLDIVKRPLSMVLHDGSTVVFLENLFPI